MHPEKNNICIQKLCMLCLSLFLSNISFTQELKINNRNDGLNIAVIFGGQELMKSPEEGLWSIATGWSNDWPSNWHHVKADSIQTIDDWKIVTGHLLLPEGQWLLKDAYHKEEGKVKCIRRFEWKGKDTLDHVTLSIRWKLPSAYAKPFLPGILYYGNPSGEKNGRNNVAWYHGQPGEEALFEEHRYPMPFACMEWQNKESFYGAALHSIPSPVYQGNHFDQWWSLGVKNNTNDAELLLMSGPICFNQKYSISKALQDSTLHYGDTWLKVSPGTIIEKTFFLEASSVSAKGLAFERPVHTALNLFKPFYTDDLPSYKQIIESKYRFTKSRWIEGKKYAGYNMFPSFLPQRIVLGWAGQCEAPGFALQALAKELNDKQVFQKSQKLLDFICTSPLDENGFCVEYDIKTNQWSQKDPVSQGQALYNIELAIQQGRLNRKVVTKSWETFAKRACMVFAGRLLKSDWKPKNTAEAFFVAPLLTASKLFNNSYFKKAALKAVEYYADRHLSMDEPYWGGTLDATCEDKEGAWGAFQAFLSAYEFTKDRKYLQYARHACDVVLSYTVIWDIPQPAGRLADHSLKTRGWTGVSVQNQHLDVYGVLISPSVYKMGLYLNDPSLIKLAKTMFLSCGQLVDPSGSQGEQIQETNFAQQGQMNDVYKLRGGYSERWTVFWITAHFLNAAAQFKALGVTW